MSPTGTSDESAVLQAAYDYIDAFYLPDWSLFERSVWKDFNKIGFAWREEKDEYSRPLNMSAERAKELIGEWGIKHSKPENAVRKATVLEVNDQTAIAKVEAFWGFDYLQLAKIDGRWMIVHILWQSNPPAYSG